MLGTDLHEVVLDLDDLTDQNDPLQILLDLRVQYPELKVTIFAIPSQCSRELLDKYKALKWVELAIHGYHHSSMECAAWGAEETKNKVEEILETGYFVKGFKAPGWVGNQMVHDVLDEMGVWRADHIDHIHEWDCSIGPRYVYNERPSNPFGNGHLPIHGHTWETCGNGPKWWVEEVRKLPVETEFRFVSEVLKVGTNLEKMGDEIGLVKGDVVVDIGAFKGEEAYWCGRRGIEIHCFEPYPMFAEKIRTLFGSDPNVHLYEVAAWKENGRATFFKPEEDWFSSGGSIIDGKIHSDKTDPVEVETRDIGDFLVKLDKPVKLLKIDAEGAEWVIMERILEEFGFERIEHVYIEDHTEKIKDEKWHDHRRTVLSALRKADVKWKAWP